MSCNKGVELAYKSARFNVYSSNEFDLNRSKSICLKGKFRELINYDDEYVFVPNNDFLTKKCLIAAPAIYSGKRLKNKYIPILLRNLNEFTKGKIYKNNLIGHLEKLDMYEIKHDNSTENVYNLNIMKSIEDKCADKMSNSELNNLWLF